MNHERRDLEIRIHRRARKNARCRVEIRGPGDRHAEGRFRSPFTQSELLEALAARDQGQIDTETARGFGAALFDALIREDVKAIYEASRGVNAGQTNLRLIVDDPETAGIPWELMVDPATDVIGAGRLIRQRPDAATRDGSGPVVYLRTAAVTGDDPSAVLLRARRLSAVLQPVGKAARFVVLALLGAVVVATAGTILAFVLGPPRLDGEFNVVVTEFSAADSTDSAIVSAKDLSNNVYELLDRDLREPGGVANVKVMAPGRRVRSAARRRRHGRTPRNSSPERRTRTW